MYNVLFLKIVFLKRLSCFLKFYTINSSSKLKIATKCVFSCSIQKKVLPLRCEPAPRDVCTSSAGGADIFKRRLLALCSGCQKSRKFQPCSGLSNDRCLRGIDLSLCAYFGTLFAYLYMRYAYLNYIARGCIYIRRGLRVVGLTW